MNKKIVPMTSPIDGRADFHRRITSQPRKKGSRIQSVGLTRAAQPHSNPYPDQYSEEVDSRRLKVADTINASMSAARLWSQVHSSGNSTAKGRNAQSQAEASPTLSLKTFFPMANMGQHVAAENALFIVWQKTTAPKTSRWKSLYPMADNNG